MKNVVAYLRVSTEAQCGDDRFGLDTQKQMIIEYCEKNNMEVTEWFVERGVSGAKDNRPEFNKILEGNLTNPPIEAVVVAKNDRIARDVNLYFAYKYQLSKQNIELISVSEDFGQLGIFAPVLEAFLASMAQVERELITTRTSGGRKAKASQGGYSGGRAPMGYRVENKKLVVNPEEAEVVKFIFERKFAGKTMLSTVDALNEAGYKTRNGKPFVISTVQSIWNNEPTYRGMYKYGKDGEWVRGEHEAIL